MTAIPLLGVALVAATLSRTAALPPAQTPRAETAVQARALYRRLYAFKNDPANVAVLSLPEAELGAVLHVAGRVLPGLRAQGTITEEALTLTAALPLPAGFWLNTAATVLPSASGVRLGAAKLGALDLPPRAVLWLGTALADLLLGGSAASRVLAAIGPVQLQAGHAELVLDMPLTARDALSVRVETALQRAAVPFDTAPARNLLAAMARAQEAGRLPNGGSLVDWMQFALEQAPDGGTAILALAVACGDGRISQLAGWHTGPVDVDCSRVMLGNRFDLRQHFVISAGLEVAAALGSAIAVGELKELYDSRPNGSGFSFDDLAANRAGIAFARAVMATDADGRQAMAGRLGREAAILPRVSDLDSGLSAARFTALYGSIDSPEYAAAIVEIDRRIAALSFHAGQDGSG